MGATLRSIHPSQPELALQELFKHPQYKKKWLGTTGPTELQEAILSTPMVLGLVESYKHQPDWTQKRQLLSLFAPHHADKVMVPSRTSTSQLLIDHHESLWCHSLALLDGQASRQSLWSWPAQ